MSDFMQKQVTRKQRWIKVESNCGTDFLNVYDTGLDIPNGNAETDSDTAEILHAYTEGEPDTWENIEGYGARLSAPGYLDCTEWTVFASAEEAQKYLDETYPDDEDENEEVSA